MPSADKVYRKILTSPLVKSKFFSRGWGELETYQALLQLRKAVLSRDECNALIASTPTEISIEKVKSPSSCNVYQGRFLSPLAVLAPRALPPEARMARFELLEPSPWNAPNGARPLFIHLAGTGDHFFWRRRVLTAGPLLREGGGVGALILENPFCKLVLCRARGGAMTLSAECLKHNIPLLLPPPTALLDGTRKPHDQVRSYLLNVSDLLIMGLALILESLALYHWLVREGYGPLGITGLSMGGHNSSLSSTVWPDPHVIVPCLSWTTAATVFTTGLLSEAVQWPVLQEQLRHSKQNNGELWQFFTTHVPPLYVKDKCSNTVEEEGESWEAEGQRRTTNWTKLLSTHRSSFDMMYSLLNFSTHLKHFSKPLGRTSAIFLTAKHDSYVPREDDVTSVWPGCEVRYMDGGHVSTSILKQRAIRSVLSEAMAKRLQTVSPSLDTFIQ